MIYSKDLVMKNINSIKNKTTHLREFFLAYKYSMDIGIPTILARLRVCLLSQFSIYSSKKTLCYIFPFSYNIFPTFIVFSTFKLCTYPILVDKGSKSSQEAIIYDYKSDVFSIEFHFFPILFIKTCNESMI